MKMFAFVLATLALVGAHADATGADLDAQALGAALSLPKPVKDVLIVRPFTLAKGYRNTWSKERALVYSGVLVVLEVDPALVVPRNAAEPVLYAGNTPVQRLNQGHRSGRVIGIVPGVADLAGALIWFGAPDLPERATAETTRAERARAEQSGLRPLPAEKFRSVMRPPAAAEDLAALLRDHVAPLVLEYSPQEKELADTWRLDTAKAPPKQR